MRLFVGLAAVFGLALALRAGLVAFAGYVVLGVAVLSRYLARRWVASLAAERTFDNHPREVGQSADVAVRVTNTGRLPIAWVLVEDMYPEAAVRHRRLGFQGGRLRLMFLRAGQTKAVRYTVTFRGRGYWPVGPCVAETGDVFGLHRRHRVLTAPSYVMVYPAVVPMPAFDFASRRPVGEVRLANRLFEDPTRTAGVRPYQLGDPLQRVHWRATARTGQLHSRVYEPTSLAGATLLVDFHTSGYPDRGEPWRSDLAVTAACSIAYAVSVLNQQVGLASNGRDAAERIRAEALTFTRADAAAAEFATRHLARERFEVADATDRLQPVVVPTRRAVDQFQQVREALARLELTDGTTFPRFVLEVGPRLPKDATVIAVLGAVPVDTAVALGHLRRQGFAVSAVLIGIGDDEEKAVAVGRLAAEGVRDARVVNRAEDLGGLGDPAAAAAPPEYAIAVGLA